MSRPNRIWFGKDQVDPAVRLVLLRNGVALSSIELSPAQLRVLVSGVQPGAFSLLNAMGQQVWAATLTAYDLVRRPAARPESIDVAAAAGIEPPQEPTRTFIALGGRVRIRVFPALESGWFEIGLHPNDAPSPDGGPRAG